MDGTHRAVFVRIVSVSESLLSLATEAKALTWDTFCEHAVFGIADGRRILVRGGRFGIELDQAVAGDPLGRPAHSLWADMEGKAVRVTELVLHTHPQPTGPSDDDLRIMEILGQSESYLFEIFGPSEGTLIRPKGSKR